MAQCPRNMLIWHTTLFESVPTGRGATRSGNIPPNPYPDFLNNARGTNPLALFAQLASMLG